MAERLSCRPRTTPLAGHWTGKVATSKWCARCETLHRTRRHGLGEEPCPLAPCWGCEHPRREHGEDGTGACRRLHGGCRCARFVTLEAGVTPLPPFVKLGSLGPKSKFNPGNQR